MQYARLKLATDLKGGMASQVIVVSKAYKKRPYAEDAPVDRTYISGVMAKLRGKLHGAVHHLDSFSTGVTPSLNGKKVMVVGVDVCHPTNTGPTDSF